MSDRPIDRVRLRTAALALAALAVVRPCAARAQAGTPLDEDAVVAQALAANPTLAAAVLERERADALVIGEEARYGLTLAADAQLNIGNTPTLTRTTTGAGAVNVSYNEQVALGAELRRPFETGTALSVRAQGARQFRRAVFIPTMPPIEVGPGYAFDVTLGVTQPLLRGFGERMGRASLRLARLDRDRATLARTRAASELVRDTLVAYWELWYAEASRRVRQDDLALAVRSLEEAEGRASLGALAHADVLAFATRRAAADEGVVASDADVEVRRAELRRLVAGATIEGVAETPPPVPAPHAPAETIVARALEAAPDLRELAARVAQADEAARTAGASLEPRLDVSGQLGVHGLGYDDVGQTFSQLGTFAAVTALVQLTFEMPLDDTQHRMELERARLAVEVATRQLEAATRQLDATVARLTTSADAARARLALAERTVSLAEELAVAERQRFDAGARTALSVTQAENELRDARLRALRAQVDLVTLDVQLAHLEGGLLDRVDAAR